MRVGSVPAVIQPFVVEFVVHLRMIVLKRFKVVCLSLFVLMLQPLGRAGEN